MKGIEEMRRRLVHRKNNIAREYGVRRIGIFGSYARGEEKKGSDLDVLVEFSKPIGLLKFIELEMKLGRIAGRKVDLVTRGALKRGIGRRILKEAVYI